jgi:hypothetical protein
MVSFVRWSMAFTVDHRPNNGSVLESVHCSQSGSNLVVPASQVCGKFKSEVSEMYGPPSDFKGKVQREEVCVNVSGLWVEVAWLPAAPER